MTSRIRSALDKAIVGLAMTAVISLAVAVLGGLYYLSHVRFCW